MSQGDLATKSGLQPSAISHFETGNRSPSFDNLKRLADALTVTTDYLLGRAEDPGRPAPKPGACSAMPRTSSADDFKTLESMAKVFAEKNRPKGGRA